MKHILITVLLLVLAFGYSSFVTLYKLDYHYFFTDEILYVQAGQEYKQGDYTLNLQHPLLGKYVSAISSASNITDVFLLRLPFAILGTISSFLVFLIIKREISFTWGLISMVVYLSLPFIHETNRMVLLESPMHFFWLLSSYFLLSYIRTLKTRFLLFAFAFWGFSLAVKFTSVVLLPAIIVALIYTKAPLSIKTILLCFLLAFICSMLTYSHLMLIEGFSGLEKVIRAFKDTILERNAEGKLHVVGDAVYNTSPWWFYLYYIKTYYGIWLGLVLIPVFIIGLRFKKADQVFWLSLLLFGLIYFQSIPLKNARYISSLEIPLTFILTYGFYDLSKTRFKYLLVFLLMFIVGRSAMSAINAKPTSYHAAYIKLVQDTNNFTNGDRLLIFGSFRSSHWYFKGPEDIVVIRKDLEPLKGEFFNFKYILVDESERLKYPNNILFQHFATNEQEYDVDKFDGLELYILKNETC